MITPEVMQSTNAVSGGVVAWAGVLKIAVTEDHAFFFTGPTTANVLPKHAFDRAAIFGILWTLPSAITRPPSNPKKDVKKNETQRIPE